MAKVLLINPRNEIRMFGGMPPLGIAWIAAVLENNDYSVRILDLDQKKTNVRAVIQRENPRLVGISGTTYTRFESFKIARVCKTILPDTVTVYGGPHATFTADDTLRHVPEVDIIARGEGEFTFLDIAKALIEGEIQLQNILGVSYRQNGEIKHNPPRPLIRDLDSLPFPARHLLAEYDYDLKLDYLNLPAASMITSRGCPINCSFCSASAMFGKSYRTRSAQNVADEVEMLVDKYNIKGIKFFDSTMTISRSHIESICNEFLKRGFDIPWECEIRVDTVDKELLKKMKAAGCYYVDFGIESASPRVLKLMGKKISVQEAINVINWTFELGIRSKVFFTFGHIGERLEDSQATLEFIERFRKKITYVASNVGIRIYPGTAVEGYALSRGYLPRDFSWCDPSFREDNRLQLEQPPHIPILIQPHMGYSELMKIRRHDLRRKLFTWDFIKRKALAEVRSVRHLTRILAAAIIALRSKKKVSFNCNIYHCRRMKKKKFWGTFIPENHSKYLYLLNFMRYEFAEPFVKGRIVLDAGCGVGYGSNHLASMAEKVIGIDISQQAIERAKKDYKKANLQFKVMDATNLEFPENCFDVVLSFEVIEHIEDYKSYLSEISRVLKPSGYCLISTPNKEVFGEGLVPSHVREFNYLEFSNIMKSHFNEVNILGQYHNVKARSLYKNPLTRKIFRIKAVLKIERNLLPRGLQTMLEKVVTGTTSDQAVPEDFSISDDVKGCIVFLAICKNW